MRKFIHIGVLTSVALTTNAADPNKLDCQNALTTIEINACASQDAGDTQSQYKKYLQASLNAYDGNELMIQSINKSETAWAEYREAHCGAVWNSTMGSIRTRLTIACEEKLTRQRTHDLWEAYLTYMDSTPPALPEPKI